MSFKKKNVSGKDKKRFLAEASKMVEGVEEIFHKKTNLIEYEGEKGSALMLDGKAAFILIRGDLIPSLHTIRKYRALLPKIVVDLGAIKFVTKGADIMRPGITEIDPSVAEGDLVLVVEEKNGAPLAIGRALYDHKEMSAMSSGKVIKNLHYLKDDWWSMSG